MHASILRGERASDWRVVQKAPVSIAERILEYIERRLSISSY